MESSDHIPHEVAVAAVDAQPVKAPAHITAKGLGEAFKTVGALIVAAGLVGNLAYNRWTGQDAPDRAETLRQRANLSFLPVTSGAQRAEMNAQAQAMELLAFRQQEERERKIARIQPPIPAQ